MIVYMHFVTQYCSGLSHSHMAVFMWQPWSTCALLLFTRVQIGVLCPTHYLCVEFPDILLCNYKVIDHRLRNFGGELVKNYELWPFFHELEFEIPGRQCNWRTKGTFLQYRPRWVANNRQSMFSKWAFQTLLNLNIILFLFSYMFSRKYFLVE